VVKNTHSEADIWFFDTEKTGIGHWAIGVRHQEKILSERGVGDPSGSPPLRERKTLPAQKSFCFFVFLPDAQCLTPNACFYPNFP